MADEVDDATTSVHARAERSAHAAERLFELVVNDVIDYAILMLDPNGRIVTWNAGAERLTGYGADEIVGLHISCFYTPESIAAGLPEHQLEVAKREGRLEADGWRVRKDGSPYWASAVTTAVRESDGALIGLVMITRDLTERKLHEEAIRQSEERFRLLIESVKDYAIFMLDPDGYITSWNEGARRIKGYEADEIIGQHFSRFYLPEALARHWPEYELEVAKREGRFEDEGWRVRKDGTLFWANVVITALFGPDGRLRGFAKITRDLTDRRRVESLEEANQRMNDFLAMVSHELRTPLNSMLGWMRILQGRPIEDDVVRRGLATILRNTLAQAQLVEDLLDVSRIMSGRLRLATDLVDIERAVRVVVDSFRLAAEAKGIELELSVEPAVGFVRGDGARLQQVFWNLLSNAIKFTSAGGRVEVRVARVDSLVDVSVADTGQGIDPAFLPHVFEEFRQADASSTRQHGGLGLGLTIVKHIAESHAGSVHVLSEGLGRGATFVVRLPVAADRPTVGTEAVDGERETDALRDLPFLKGARVLVVEDEADTREVLLVVLEQAGAEARSAASAAEALVVLDTWVPDVIVSDIGMPGEDGHELMRRVRARPAERGGAVPAVALTAYARVGDRMEALQAGYQMHVAKPVEPVELVKVVHDLLEFQGSVNSTNDAGDQLS